MSTNILNVKQQFNKQAQNFDEWSVTRDEKSLLFLYKFCKMESDDVLLDVACGTGGLALYFGKTIKKAHGIDISDKMINIAQQNLASLGVKNVHYNCGNVEKMPFEDDTFSAVVCRTAFHHMENFADVFREMIRCCRPGGRICIQDILPYDNPRVNDFFRTMEKAIDISHWEMLPKQTFVNLYEKNQVKIIRRFSNEVTLDLIDYQSHAVQSDSNQKTIKQLTQAGLKDKEISKYLYIKDEHIVFKRHSIFILGQVDKNNEIVNSES